MKEKSYRDMLKDSVFCERYQTLVLLRSDSLYHPNAVPKIAITLTKMQKTQQFFPELVVELAKSAQNSWSKYNDTDFVMFAEFLVHP